MDDRVIARWRMHTLRLVGHSYPSVPAAVGGLLAVQGENYAHTAWALTSRTPGGTMADFQRVFDEGQILRTHLLRPTWHMVLPDDIHWLVALTAPRIDKLVMQQLGDLDGRLDRALEVITDALSAEGHLTRKALRDRLLDQGIDVEGRMMFLALKAEMLGLICSGAMQGKEQTYALLSERAPNARVLEPDDALAEVALRYFRGHGPATERDLAYWATLTITDVRAGLSAVADQLERFEHDGRTYWYSNPEPDDGVLEPRAHLLLIFDESYRGYQDSRGVIDADGLEPNGRGANIGMTLVDGQLVGDMRRSIKGSTVTFDVRLHRDLSDDEAAEVHAAAERCAAFLELEPNLSLSRTPRR